MISNQNRWYQTKISCVSHFPSPGFNINMIWFLKLIDCICRRDQVLKWAPETEDGKQILVKLNILLFWWCINMRPTLSWIILKINLQKCCKIYSWIFLPGLIPQRSGVYAKNCSLQSCSNIKVPPILMRCVKKCNNDLKSFIWQPLQTRPILPC